MAAVARKGGLSLFKRGWNEIPEVVGSLFMMAVGFGLGVAGVVNYYSKDGDNRKHKLEYIVIRHDDPRASRVRTGING